MPAILDNEHPWRITVIEDDASIRNFLRTSIEQEGWSAETVASAGGALALLQEQPPDLVLLDLGLPDMDGTTLIRKIRAFSTIPIVVLSARTQEQDKVHALDCGADDYLTKPIGAFELKARLRAHLRRRSGATPSCRFSDVIVDMEHRQVTKAGSLVHLTPIEFRILAQLCRQEGKVVTQRELLREIWGPDHTESQHYLRIHVGHLRTKLEEKPALPKHILTELGVGYRLMLDPEPYLGVRRKAPREGSTETSCASLGTRGI